MQWMKPTASTAFKTFQRGKLRAQRESKGSIPERIRKELLKLNIRILYDQEFGSWVNTQEKENIRKIHGQECS